MTDYDIDMDRWHEPVEGDLAEALPGAACRRAPRAPVGRGRERVLAPREPEPSTLLLVGGSLVWLATGGRLA